jgi:hypothetical protein
MSAACHGNPAADALSGKFDENTWQGSGTAWIAADPHTRAYSLLTDTPLRPVRASAAHIMKNLGSSIPATEDARCLACHSNPALATHGNDPHVVALRQEGVGCESCHGNASGWIREHTTWKPDLDDQTRHANYDKTGMTTLFFIGSRAMTCVGCHVGAPADPARGLAVRDMNHDMIAAGHPRLNFDFAEFHRELPKHWQEKDRAGFKPRGPHFEARLWAVGRIAQAETACALLADRAARAKAGDPRTPWPELAEYNCASCHHELFESWRGEAKALGNRPLGSLRWQTIWPITESPEFTQVKEVLSKMQKTRPGGFGEIGAIAQQSAGNLQELRRNWAKMADADLVSRTRKFFPSEVATPTDWDTAGQMLWGLAALQRARLLDRQPEDFTRAFELLRQDYAGSRKWDTARPALDKLLGTP